MIDFTANIKSLRISAQDDRNYANAYRLHGASYQSKIDKLEARARRTEETANQYEKLMEASQPTEL